MLKLIALLFICQTVLSIGPAQRRVNARRNGPAKSRNVEGPFGDVVGPDKLDLTFPPDIENDDDSSQRGILNEVDGRLDLHDSSIGRKEK
ncbi:hypothetical protein D918_00052 [Trichuris suis]|nr:hypothetical protein D918_00052 [Trichuris suis]